MTTAQKAILALVAANIIWGAASPIFKLSLENIPPFTLAFWRFFLGSAILMTIFGPKVVKLSLKTKRDVQFLIFYALFGITFNIIFYFLGLQLTLSLNAPIISASAPILTMILAFILLSETFQLRKFVGILFGFSGIVLIIIEPLLKVGLDGSFLGNIYLVIATLGAVGQTIIGRKILPKVKVLPFTFWAFIIGASTFLPLAVYEVIQNPLLYAQLDGRGYFGILYGSIFSSAAAYGLFAWGLSKLQATDASMFAYIDPIVGTVLAYFMLHEPISIAFIFGSILIFGGIFIAEGKIHHYPVGKLLKRQK